MRKPFPIAFCFCLAILLLTGCHASPPTYGTEIPGSTVTDKNGNQLERILSPLLTTPNNDVAPGEKVHTKISYTVGAEKVWWDPPCCPSDIVFRDVQPEPGGPPYYFKNVSAEQLQAGIHIEYSAPSNALGNRSGFVEQAGLTTVGGVEYSVAQVYYYKKTSAQDSLPAALAQTWAEPTRPDADQASWSFGRLFMPPGIQMTTELCQQYVSELQSANVFMVWNVPLTTTLNPGEAAQLPFVFTAEYTPTIYLQGSGNWFEMPLEYRSDAMQWAYQNLEEQRDRLWVALGVDRSLELTCPDYFNIGAGNLQVSIDAQIDLNDLPNDCEGCQIPSYICSKTASSGALALAAQLFNSGAGSSWFAPETPLTYADGFVCLGPEVTPLVDTGNRNWMLEALPYTTIIEPGALLTLTTWVENYTGITQTFNLAVDSNLDGAEWRLYPSRSNDIQQPDLERPLGAQFQSPPGDWQKPGNHLWMLANIPAEARGQYTVSLMVSNPALYPAAWPGVSTIWVGEAPPAAKVEPGVSLTASAPETVHPGGLLTYTLNVINSGAFDLHGLVISATLPANTSFLACRGGDTCALQGNLARWELASLGAGRTHPLILGVQISAQAALGSKIVCEQTAVSSADGAVAAGARVETLVTNPNAKRMLYLPLLRR